MVSKQKRFGTVPETTCFDYLLCFYVYRHVGGMFCIFDATSFCCQIQRVWEHVRRMSQQTERKDDHRLQPARSAPQTLRVRGQCSSPVVSVFGVHFWKIVAIKQVFSLKCQALHNLGVTLAHRNLLDAAKEKVIKAQESKVESKHKAIDSTLESLQVGLPHVHIC